MMQPQPMHQNQQQGYQFQQGQHRSLPGQSPVQSPGLHPMQMQQSPVIPPMGYGDGQVPPSAPRAACPELLLFV